MSPEALVSASRVTGHLPTSSRGPWSIDQLQMPPGPLGERLKVLYPSGLLPGESFTLLRRGARDTVMEDTPRELRRHLPVLIPARGRVLVSGLGLGCVVRGLLAKPQVEHVDVVEIDPTVVELVWPHLIERDPEIEHRATLHLDDALTIHWPRGTRWDFAWHDVHHEDAAELARMHVELLARHQLLVRWQGAWQLPRELRRLLRRWRQPNTAGLLDGRSRRRMH